MSDDIIKIKVFGPGYGESIVLYIPSIGWGIVDSCTCTIDKEKVNPALAFLKQENVTRLAFIILTHPHEDHYQGLEEIIAEYNGRIDRIACYAGTGLREYREYLSINEVLGGKGLRGLARVFQSFKSAEEKGASRKIISECTSIIRRLDTLPNVDILALSPSAVSQEKYRDILFEAIPRKDGDIINFVSDKHHNLLSSAIYFRVGEAVFILGSDVEIQNHPSSGWEGIMNSGDLPALACDFVKVPHHGSETGFSHSLWQKFSFNKSPVSVITPYSHNKNPLPREEVLNSISDYSNLVAVTSNVKFVKPKYVYSRTAINNLKGVRSWNCLVNPVSIGSVTIELSVNDGGVTNIDVASPAFVYKKAS